MNLLRPLVILALIAIPVSLSAKYSEHHVGPSDFQTLYMHLMPAKLVKSAAHDAGGHGEAGHEAAEEGAAGHGEEPAHEGDEGLASEAGHAAPGPGDYLVALPLPGFLSFFDLHVETDPAGERVADQPIELVLTNLQLFQIAAALLIFACFWGVPRYLRTGKGDAVARLFSGWAMWIRDEMVVPVMGKENGARFLPLFLGLFFFILFMNMLGLVPGSATATANIFVTGAMAVVTLSLMIFGGMAVQGPVAYWKHLVPHVPLPLWPLMFVVELIGVFVKPFALTIRLFANMTGGHLVVLSLMGVLFFFAAEMGQAVGWISSPVWVGFAVFIMIIEFFVAMLQAYIFTMLSILFVQASLHPEH